MRRVLAVMGLAVLAGCGSNRGGAATGAESSDAAVQQFVFAAKAEDLQAMSAVWGDAEMPTRERVSRQELEQRLLITICHLRSDESRIGPARAAEGGRVAHIVTLTKGDLRAESAFTTVRNTKSGRWYVENIDLTVLQPFCKASVPQSRRIPPLLGADAAR
ncbi:MAG: hypothetical protein KJZ74_07455 [Gemmatimonadales bacterium]|nr:hypothetical protein [Gemmatimonadota bacterium]MCL4213732.1 hypothetical protein [Gemmatimonadales bacterium]